MRNHHEASPEISSASEGISGVQTVIRPGQISAARAWRDRVAALAPDANRAELLELLATAALALDVAHARAAAVDRELITSRAALDTLATTVEQATRDARRLSDEAARIRLTNAITGAVRAARTAARPTA